MDTKRDVAVVSVKAGAHQEKACASYDDNELSEWANDGQSATAWITYTLAREAEIDNICLKLNGWRSRSYPLEVYAGNQLVWSGNTDKSLGYVHLHVDKPVRSDEITIRMKGGTTDKDAFGQIIEVAGGAANDMEKRAKVDKGNYNLRIIEIEFLETIR